MEANLDASTLVPLDRVGWWNGPITLSHRANVVFVTVEAMRHDVVLLLHQGQEVTPNINKLARDGVQWTRAYSQTTYTDYSTVSLFSSTFPLRALRQVYFRPTDPWPKTLIYDVLKSAGYATAMISSQNEGWSGMDHFLASPHLDLFYDPKRAPPVQHADRTTWADNFPDAQTADRAAAWIREEAAAGRPFFLAVNFQSSHFPYRLPSGCETPFQPGRVDFPVGFLAYAEDKTEIMRNAYFNALHECDRQLGRLVDALRDTGQLTNTIIFVCGDHGQAFHEHGYVTHAREPIEPVIRTASVLFGPGLVSPRMDDYPVELVDIVPTVLALLGVPPHPGFQGIDVFSPHRPLLGERTLFFHTENALTRTDVVLLAGRWKYWLNRESKRESLFDLATDPAERLNTIKDHPALARELGRALREWRQRQLAYYLFPQYYQNFYPPAPPTVTPPDSARGDR